VRFITAAALVNQLLEAQREQTLSRMAARWARIELIVLDELGYVPLAEVAAELLFRVIADRAEKAAINWCALQTRTKARRRQTSLSAAWTYSIADARQTDPTITPR
jgi:DNA replication protein DnaC